MLRNYLAAACRNIWRNKLHAALNIAGLAVGFTAGLLIALFVNDEQSYDRFWPHHEQLYMVSTTLRLTAVAPVTIDGAPYPAIAMLRQRLPAKVIIARQADWPQALRRGEIELNETVSWVDAAFFSVLPVVPLAGDLHGAFERPDGLVLTEHIARKYFGDASPLGQLVELDRQRVMRVMAVVRDIPGNSFLKADVFGSGRARFGRLGALDVAPDTSAVSFPPIIQAYLSLPPGWSAARAGPALKAAADEFLAAAKLKDVGLALKLLPVADIHLSSPAVGGMKPRGNPALLDALVMIGVGIVAMAGINFVNLMTARATRRGTEIGVRKAVGATPDDLIAQFIGESLLYSAGAMLIALALVELLLPAVNEFLQRDISLDYGQDLAFCLLVVVLAGLGAGFYPALVLARYRAAAVLRGTDVQARSGAAVRQALVASQFAVLICLFVATIVVYRQVEFALNEGLRLDKDQVLTVMTPCKSSFPAEVRKLPGVRSAACSESAPPGDHNSSGPAAAPDGTRILVLNEAVEPGALELYGLHPVAGRFFSRARTAEELARGGGGMFIGPVVINETAVRKLHFASSQAALGQVLRRPGPVAPSEIIGVAPDVPVDSVRSPVEATVFHTDADYFNVLSIKLAGRQIPEALKSIGQLWKRIGEPRPIRWVFVDRMIQDRYLAEVRQGKMFAVFGCVALFIACLGLFGLATFMAERRTKEIGVRKAMGATRGEIVRLLLWQLTRPVLVANLIAWPVGFYLMSRWLQGFAYHIELAPWMFLAAGGLALAIAWLTVWMHACMVARQHPVSALRYE